MELATQYGRQYSWRSWQQAYQALPPLNGARVLDLGCAIGDQSRDLTSRGAQVVGVDADECLIAHARSRQIPGAVFNLGDVRDPGLDGKFDGIWASFLPAYFPDFAPVLARWRGLLHPGGWIALTEVCGLFSHEPLAAGARGLLDSYVRDAFGAGRYDFGMGGKLAAYLKAAGFKIEVERILPDRELSFTGPAGPDVLEAWAERLARMTLLQERARRECPSLKEEWLRCLSAADHSTDCRVHFCIARRT